MEEFKIEKNENSKYDSVANKRGIIAAVVLIVIISISLLIAFFKIRVDVYDEKMNVYYIDYMGYNSRITGKVKNTGFRKISYIQIQFSLYNSLGYNIGTAFANKSELDAGEIWSFEAFGYSLSSKPVSFKLADISCW